MNKLGNIFSLALTLLLLLSAKEVVADGTGQRIVVNDVGFATPESVQYYADEDVYLVSNINGSSAIADNNGFISKLLPDGTLVALKWLDGSKENVTLNAPKGMAITGSNTGKDKHLFVADLNQVQVFTLPDGAQKASIHIQGSAFLNGVTPGPDGSVYVTDTGFAGGAEPTGTDAIYQVWPDGRYQTILKDEDLEYPNGIWWDKEGLLVNSLGADELFSLDSSGELNELPSPPAGGLDGLVRLDDGRLVVSSWAGSALYALGKDGKFTVLADGLTSPADLGVDSKRHRLLVPLFKENRVIILSY